MRRVRHAIPWKCLLPALALALSGAPAASAAESPVPIDLALAIMVDVSASMDKDEFALQRFGYVAAFAHPDILRAILSGRYRRIAVTYVEWSTSRLQKVIVPWRLIDDAATAQSFSRELAEQPATGARSTSISAALAFGAGLIAENGFEPSRKAIDISGDGPNNSGPPVAPARDSVVAQGIVINGLPILIRPSPIFPEMDRFYEDCVIGGPGAFVLPVHDIEQLGESIRRKLIMEIAERPAGHIVPAEGRVPVDCLIGEKTRDRFVPYLPGLDD